VEQTTASAYAKENYDIFDFELTAAEMKELNAI
jgi:diketogulonate reductase-like aldo/keto reductase